MIAAARTPIGDALRKVVAGCLIACLGSTAGMASTTAQEGTGTDFSGFVSRAMDNVIVPGFVALETAAEALDAGVGAYCATPSDETATALHDAFAATATAWGHVQFLPIAPLDTDNRRDRFFFWPDPRGTTLRQIQPIIVDRDESVTDPVQLHDKSVALQGLGALEYVLYGTGAESIRAGDDDGRFRCAYATAITTGLVDMASALAAETAPGSDFDQAIRNPGPDNPVYPTPDAAMADLIIGAGNAVELVRDSLLLPVLGEALEFARPHIAPLWRGSLSMTFLKALADGSQQLLNGGDLLQVLPQDMAWISGFPRLGVLVDRRCAAIRRRVDRRSGGRWRLSPGALSPRRLHRQSEVAHRHLGPARTQPQRFQLRRWRLSGAPSSSSRVRQR